MLKSAPIGVEENLSEPLLHKNLKPANEICHARHPVATVGPCRTWDKLKSYMLMSGRA